MKNSDKSKQSRRDFILKSSTALASFTIVPRFVLGGAGYLPPSDKITLGFIGAGMQSGGLGGEFLKLNDIQMVAVCDVDKLKRARFKKKVEDFYAAASATTKYKGCDEYEDYKKLLKRKDIDGVIIAMPDHWHAIPAIAAMKAGKDVYCEKPLSHTIEEGRAMVNAVKKYERVLQTGTMQRSWENFRKACELVRNGYIGEITQVKVNVGDPGVACDLEEKPAPDYIDWDRWCGPSVYRGYHEDLAPPIPEEFWPRWRNYKEYGGGILCDWGAHMFDIAQWGLGMDNTGPVEIIPPADKTAVRGMVFKYANGVEMVHEDFKRGFAVRFVGTDGILDISRGFLESLPANVVDSEIKEGELRLYKSENHYQNWIDSIKSRKQPICDVETGHRSASVCNIANIGYWLGKPLKWDPVKEEFNDEEADMLRGKEYRKGYELV